MVYPGTRWVLLDSRQRSVTFLSGAVERLGLGGRTAVVAGRAETVGHDPAHRGAYGLVVARGFGPPAVTAECAAGFLRPGGRLVVSEPPAGTGERWPPGPLAQLGLRLSNTAVLPAGHYAVLEQVEGCPSGFPRPPGRPAKRPLFA